MAGRSLFILSILGIAAILGVSGPIVRPAVAQSPEQFEPAEETPEQYPDRPGREDTFYSCTACHGFKLVAQQGQTRRQWDDTLNFMAEKHNMPVIEGNDRTVVLDYLEASFPPRAATTRGWQNPFLGR